MTLLSPPPSAPAVPTGGAGPPPPVEAQPRTPEAPEKRRSTTTFGRRDALSLFGALVAALALSGLVYTHLLPLSGAVGFVIVTYVLFLGLYALLVMQDQDGPIVRDRIMSAIVHSIAALLMVALMVVILYTLGRGLSALVHLNFFTQDMSNAGPLDGLEVGGILHAVVGTIIQISIALVITIPLGLTCAVFLSETRGRFTRFVRTIVEAMTALPSIVAGLFVFAMAIRFLGLEKCGFAASLAISVMMLPIIIRAADVVLRLVPGNLKEASYALGTSYWRTVWHVVIPTARSGLTTAVILGTARGIGETSPVLLTAGFTAVMNTNPFSGPMVSLPLATFNFVKSPEPAMIARGFGTAAVLMGLVLVLFVVARMVGGRGPGQLTRRQERRAASRSRRDAARFAPLQEMS